MSLSRRRFTQEFKLAAVERLDQGASAAEVSRAFEINPNLLHRWRRNYAKAPAMPSPAKGNGAGKKPARLCWNARSASRPFEIDFLKQCLQRIEEQRKLQASAGKPLSANRSGNKSRRNRR